MRVTVLLTSMASLIRIERRHLLLLAIILVHVVLILLLLAQRSSVLAPSRDARGGLSVFNVAADEPARPSPPRPEPAEVEVPAPVIQLDVESPIATTAKNAITALGAPGVACDLTAVVQAELRGNVAARAALSLIPSEARSVANAVMLWDGRWVDARKIGGDVALVPVRDAILMAVERAPEECRAQEQIGPRLLFVASDHGTLTLALGSGRWRWIELITAADPEPPNDDDIGQQ